MYKACTRRTSLKGKGARANSLHYLRQCQEVKIEDISDLPQVIGAISIVGDCLANRRRNETSMIYVSKTFSDELIFWIRVSEF
jgi:hypothetical protein